MEERIFYVYKWFYKDTGVIFHIGKGKNDRYLDERNSRNPHFKNILHKERDNVDVAFIKTGLTEEEAWALEKELIAEYRAKGECKTNYHEGGCGGNTGHYDSPERSRKLSEFAKARTGSKNPNYGNHRHLSDEEKKKISQALKGRVISQEHRKHMSESQKARQKSPEELERITNLNKGKKMPKERYDKMIDALSDFEFTIILNDTTYTCLGHTALYKYCKETFDISRTIVDKIIEGNWKPTFNKHKNLENI